MPLRRRSVICALLASLAFGLAACTPPQTPAPAAQTRLSEEVQVSRVAPGLWVHVTWHTFPGATEPYPANGMLLQTADGSVLIDTGWNDAQTETLLAWAGRDLRRPVRRAYVTHAHEDRIGGIAALRRAGVPVQGLALTAEIARREGVAAPDVLPGLDVGAVRVGGVELFYPGAGHARDNVVAWFPEQRVLFGGCLLKVDTATTVGNVADADVPNWPQAVARVSRSYPETRIVVPGHGAVSGASAYRVTRELIASKGPAAVERLRRTP